MKINPHYVTARFYIVAFFIAVLGIAFLADPYYPVLVVAGESSVGTWMSGALLIMAATISLVAGIQKNWFPWLPASGFFLLLALDERFMFHESVKERLLFAFSPDPAWLVQLPVFFGSLAGVIVAFILWKKILPRNRIYIYLALILGSISIIFDITERGVFIEEISKLLGELMLVLALTGEIQTTVTKE